LKYKDFLPENGQFRNKNGKDKGWTTSAKATHDRFHRTHYGPRCSRVSK